MKSGFQQQLSDYMKTWGHISKLSEPWGLSSGLFNMQETLSHNSELYSGKGRLEALAVDNAM